MIKIINRKTQNFIKSTKTSSPTGQIGATSIPFFGNAFIYIETSSGNKSNDVFVSFERTDIFQVSNISSHYNRYSIPQNYLLESLGHLRIQFLLADNTWSRRYKIPKGDRYSE